MAFIICVLARELKPCDATKNLLYAIPFIEYNMLS